MVTCIVQRIHELFFFDALRAHGVHVVVVNHRLPVEGESLSLDDVIIAREPCEGQVVESDGAMTVVLDMTMTPDLTTEGLAREIINRVQNLRKDAGFEVSDRICVHAYGDGGLADVLIDPSASTLIRGEVLAEELRLTSREDVEGRDHRRVDEIDGMCLAVAIDRVEGA